MPELAYRNLYNSPPQRVYDIYRKANWHALYGELVPVPFQLRPDHVPYANDSFDPYKIR